MHTPEDPPHLCPRCQAPIPEGAPAGLCPKCLMAEVASPTEPNEVPADTPAVEEVAAAFPELEIVQMIGRGGMGVVFKVRQPRLERTAALKILPPVLAAQPDFAHRFIREARALARLNHPNIVGVYDFGEAGGFYYLLMEFIEGVNLREALRAERFTPEQALAVVPKLCEALQYAHDEGVLHRDIKPENILLDPKGRVKLADFGIAKLGNEVMPVTSITGTGSTLGTPAYMAPEQIEKPGTVDHRADIYSLGVVFYEMLTGELPLGRFAAPSKKTPMDARIDDIVLRALEKERELRQQSATEMRTQVEDVATHPGGPPVRPAPGRLRGFSRAAVILLTLSVCWGMMIPILMALGLTRDVRPVTLVAVAALFAMAAIVTGVIGALRRPASSPPSPPKPWARWKTCLIISLFSLPIGFMVTWFAVSSVKTTKVIGIIPAIVVPLVTFAVSALLGATYRSMTGRGAPPWVAVLVCGVLLFFSGAACLAALFFASVITYQRLAVIPPAQQEIKVTASEVPRLSATEDPGDRVMAVDIEGTPGCVVEGRLFIDRGEISRELPDLAFAIHSDSMWGAWRARAKITAETGATPMMFTRSVIGLDRNTTRGYESSESSAWPRPVSWSPVRSERKREIVPGRLDYWHLFRGASTGFAPGEPQNAPPAALLLLLTVHPLPPTTPVQQFTFSIFGPKWWEELGVPEPENRRKSAATVSVGTDGSLTLEGQAISPDALKQRFAAIGLGKNTVVMVKGTTEVPLTAMDGALRAVRKTGTEARLQTVEPPLEPSLEKPEQPRLQ